MARPKKMTVDYFPHFVADGKTMFILENTFGNDGYAFWFKLLELLCSTDGHAYDCNKIAEWKFLIAKTKVSEETAIKIIKTLAELDAIDAVLWEQKIIWVQNLIDNISDVYKKRGSKIPQKPNFCHQKPSTDDVSGTENPQSKVNKSKVNNNKDNNTENESDTGISEPETQANNPKGLFEYFSEVIGHFITYPEIEVLKSFLDDGLSEEAIMVAIDEAVFQNARNIAYIKAILQSWAGNNIKTKEQALESIKIFRQKRSRRGDKESGVSSTKHISKKDSTFNAFKQRTYDFNDLKKKLLGWDNYDESKAE